MPPRIARLAALGAYGASFGLLAVLALLIYITRPTPYSGMDRTLRVMTWIAAGGTIVALVAVHVMFGKKLFDVARGVSRAA